MKVCDWIADELISRGVTDAFGLPGAILLDFIYALERRRPEITPHLCYHEQGGGYAACGYAQATGSLGLAYGTRGPGMSNMITSIAEAYYDSLPVLFVTAHSTTGQHPEMRVETNQEMDTVSLVAGITKYAARVDDTADVRRLVEKACTAACSGRKGPVFLDFSSGMLQQELSEGGAAPAGESVAAKCGAAAKAIADSLRGARRPVVLIGNGVRQSGTEKLVMELAEKAQIPVVSSRISQDIMPASPLYYGHIGSHAARYAGFILSKADLIIALGNRMAFPVDSPSFRPVAEHATTLRVDIDSGEFLREIPNCTNYEADLAVLLPALVSEIQPPKGAEEWLAICKRLKCELQQWDKDEITDILMSFMKCLSPDIPFVCDVGNHSFRVSNAYTYLGARNRVLYSGSFGTLGCALPKSIGVCLGLRRPVVCFTGDQGFQMNLQELQSIANQRLPITVAVMNNHSSAMIREREEAKYGNWLVHTTESSGYGVPDLRMLAQSFRMEYRHVSADETPNWEECVPEKGPCLLEIEAEEPGLLSPNLPRGHICQDMTPPLPERMYAELDAL